MSLNDPLRKAKPVNVREAQAQLSKLIKSKSPSVVLSHGKPVSFLVPYEDMLDLVETFDELKDKKLLGEIEQTRKDCMQEKAVYLPSAFSEKWASRCSLTSPNPVNALNAFSKNP